MIYPTTEEEKRAFYQAALPGFLEYLRSHMSAIEQVELAETREGIVSFPATQVLGGVQKTVRVPLSLIASVVGEMAEDLQDDFEAWKESAWLQLLSRFNERVDVIAGAATKTPIVEQSETTVAIAPHRLHVWGRVNSLNLTLTPGDAGIANEYMLQFTVGSENFSLTLSGTISWVEEPEFMEGYTYAVSILNGLAVAAGWEAATE